jgi:ribosome recycling factor
MSLEKQVKEQMEKTLDHFKADLRNLRTSRANPGILDPIVVEVYGAQMRLKDIANITVPEPRQLLITPFDASNTKAIGKAIENANLNLQPIVEANLVRINIPPMDEKRRKDIAKQCSQEGENAKISVRKVRRDYNNLVKQQKADGEIAEDLMKSLEKKIQVITDQYCEEVDKLCAQKQEEILKI